MYKTCQGRTVEYPFAIAARLTSGNDEQKQLVDSTYNVFRELQNLDFELTTLRSEVQNLRAENKFLLKLINERLEKGE